MGGRLMEFKDLKIGEMYTHNYYVFTKQSESNGVTPGGIPFFMNPNDKVELYKEEKHDSH
jgi:hypothetical protein